MATIAGWGKERARRKIKRPGIVTVTGTTERLGIFFFQSIRTIMKMCHYAPQRRPCHPSHSAGVKTIGAGHRIEFKWSLSYLTTKHLTLPGPEPTTAMPWLAQDLFLSPVPLGIWSVHPFSAAAAAAELYTMYLTEEELVAGFIWLSLCLYRGKVPGEAITQWRIVLRFS